MVNQKYSILFTLEKYETSNNLGKNNEVQKQGQDLKTIKIEPKFSRLAPGMEFDTKRLQWLIPLNKVIFYMLWGLLQSF